MRGDSWAGIARDQTCCPQWPASRFTAPTMELSATTVSTPGGRPRQSSPGNSGHRTPRPFVGAHRRCRVGRGPRGGMRFDNGLALPRSPSRPLSPWLRLPPGRHPDEEVVSSDEGPETRAGAAHSVCPAHRSHTTPPRRKAANLATSQARHLPTPFPPARHRRPGRPDVRPDRRGCRRGPVALTPAAARLSHPERGRADRPERCRQPPTSMGTRGRPPTGGSAGSVDTPKVTASGRVRYRG